MSEAAGAAEAPSGRDGGSGVDSNGADSEAGGKAKAPRKQSDHCSYPSPFTPSTVSMVLAAPLSCPPALSSSSKSLMEEECGI